jgi:hypothetical protein
MAIFLTVFNIDLYFWDESHFGLTPNRSYIWQINENPILLPVTKGIFFNVVGLILPFFVYTCKNLCLKKFHNNLM